MGWEKVSVCVRLDKERERGESVQRVKASENRQPIEDRRNEPPVFEPNWAFRQHRQWWAHRAISFPWFFGSVYGLLLVWRVTQLTQA